MEAQLVYLAGGVGQRMADSFAARVIPPGDHEAGPRWSSGGPGGAWRSPRRTGALLSVAGALLIPTQHAWGQELSTTNRIEELRSLNLADILNTEVTSVSKRPEKVFETPAAADIIDAEQIQRSGALNIPEVLRLSPGVDVAQYDRSKYAVGIRPNGLSRFTRGLLVMEDGRSLYTQQFGGVRWETFDYLLEDIDHIEVVRGPGGATWGANAANGVINVITKDAKDTQGVLIAGGGGSLDPVLAEVRYGFKVADDGYARVYGKYSSHDDAPGGEDGYDFTQAGFRSDFGWNNHLDHLTVEGNYFYGNMSDRVTIPVLTNEPPYSRTLVNTFPTRGGDVLLRWTHPLGEDSELSAQAFADHHEHDEFPEPAKESHFDVELQHRLVLPYLQQFQYGLGYRYLPTSVQQVDPSYAFVPDSRHYQLFTSFVQDQISFLDDKVRFVMGSRFEYNEPTGWDVLPNARLAWLPSEQHTLWAAVSRGVLVPEIDARDVIVNPLPGGPRYNPALPGVPIFLRGLGNHNLDTEKLLAYEAGYRFRPKQDLLFDVAGYYFDYSDLISATAGQSRLFTSPFTYLQTDVVAQNGASAAGYGVELSLKWQVTEFWRLVGAYSWARVDVNDPSGVEGSGRAPENVMSLLSSFDLPGNVQLDLWPRFVDALPGLNPPVPSYWDFDARLAWTPLKNLELAVVGQNLLEGQRFELSPSPYLLTQVTPAARAVYFHVALRF
jgi:iron complex outermembrane receptor protein